MSNAQQKPYETLPYFALALDPIHVALAGCASAAWT